VSEAPHNPPARHPPLVPHAKRMDRASALSANARRRTAYGNEEHPLSLQDGLQM